jgi:hypothetical protein
MLPFAFMVECHLALRPIGNESRRIRAEQDRLAKTAKGGR